MEAGDWGGYCGGCGTCGQASAVSRGTEREGESQQNYRPMVGIRKWFARHPGTRFRGLLLAEFGQGRLEGQSTLLESSSAAVSMTLSRPFVPRWRVQPFRGSFVLMSPFMWKYACLPLSMFSMLLVA